SDSNQKPEMTVDSAEFTTSLSSKYLSIQSKLGTLQSDLSKEQAKVGILSEENLTQDGLINVLFGKTPLFANILNEKSFDKDKLLQESKSSRDKILESIKSLEVESENILSVGLLQNPDSFSKLTNQLSLESEALRPISGKTVERLIQD
ncbi:MAG: hypothetical protein K8R21_15285, partial [Leptospira sp.]|nr:hypothetical protein [Leptospira sp.]